MATCVNCGLETVDGRLQIKGARSVAWPYDDSIEDRNGLRCDPETGNLWTPPDQRITPTSTTLTQTAFAPSNVGVPVTLFDKSITHGAGSDQDALVHIYVANGYIKMRQASGNFWIVQRSINVYIDEVPFSTTGNEEIAAAENNSGGVMTQGHCVEAEVLVLPLEAPSVMRVRTIYTFTPTALTANALNQVVWRSPRTQLDAFTTRPIPE